MGPRNNAMAQRNGQEDPFRTAIVVWMLTWVAGDLFFSVDENIRQVAIHVFGVGK